MRRHLCRNRLSAITAVVAGAVTALTLGGAMPAVSAARAPAAGAVRVAPHARGMLDCNGLSPLQHAVKQGLPCLDPRGPGVTRFEENDHYIGHDEPSVRFLSSQPGSGNDITFNERLPVEPAKLPTVRHPGKDVTHTFELSLAPWFSTTVCDPNSAPLLPCTPTSDSNAPSGSYPGAGAAFVELQFYPPGFAPFDDAISCDNSHWCSALTIDSLECQGNGSGACNNQCVEPVNFAYVQTNGVPTGPPGPQLSNLKSFTPNRHTLRMNPGDRITVQMFNAKIPGGHALEAKETDWSTGQSGFMIASGANGFMNTNPFNCAGTRFNFQPEYNTARAQNIIPWGIGPYMINDQFEIGHFEPCTSVRSKATISLAKHVTDTYYNHCIGPYEPARDTAKAGLEPNDAPCFKFGDTHGGLAAPNLVTGCPVFFNAIGDLDYDGTPYYPDWPNSVQPDRYPSSFRQQQPTTAGGAHYPAIQFMTDSSATQLNTNCNLVTGSGCVLPPKGPGHFYPYWTQARVGGQCVWEFGNMRNGNTFGEDAQYGSVGPGSLGAFVSPVRPNPNC
jgi:hypothetical protein